MSFGCQKVESLFLAGEEDEDEGSEKLQLLHKNSCNPLMKFKLVRHVQTPGDAPHTHINVCSKKWEIPVWWISVSDVLEEPVFATPQPGNLQNVWRNGWVRNEKCRRCWSGENVHRVYIFLLLHDALLGFCHFAVSSNIILRQIKFARFSIMLHVILCEY